MDVLFRILQFNAGIHHIQSRSIDFPYSAFLHMSGNCNLCRVEALAQEQSHGLDLLGVIDVRLMNNTPHYRQ
jgi:hypothetical protein